MQIIKSFVTMLTLRVVTNKLFRVLHALMAYSEISNYFLL